MSVLEINLIFVIFFSPIIKLYFTIKKKRNNKRKISSTISIEPKKINNSKILKGPWRVCPECGKALFPTADGNGKVYEHAFDPIETKEDGTEIFKYNCFYKEDEDGNVLNDAQKNNDRSM